MRSIVLALASVSLASTAIAADTQIIDSTPELQIVDTSGSWSGVYIGAGAGHQWSRLTFPNGSFETTINGVTTTTDHQTEGSWTGHVLGGYLFQHKQFLFGAEADWTFGKSQFRDSTLNGDGFCVPTPTCADGGAIASFETIGHVRLIGGYAFNDRTMGFLAAGLAVGRGSFTGVFARAGATEGGGTSLAWARSTDDTIEKTLLGISIGAGAEVKATSNISFRGEALFDFYRSFGINPTGAGAGAGVGSQSASFVTMSGDRVRFMNTTIRASVIFRF